MSKPSLDLSQLAIERQPPASTTPTSPITHRRRWLSRYALPSVILIGFGGLVLTAAGSRIIPARSVKVMPVIVKRVEVQQDGSTLFQAPGWIEPRPMAVDVSAMTPGIVEQLLVVAGQKIEKGEPIAMLVSMDAEIALRQSENALVIREGELNRAKAELSAARIRVENPVHLRVQLADAQSNLTKSRTELAKQPFLIEAAQANLKYAQTRLQSTQSARGAISDYIIAKAENDHAVAIASLNELLETKPNLEQELKAIENVVTTLQQQLELLVEERRQLGEAEARVQSAEAYRNEAKLLLQQAQLTLERNTIRAPMTGRILRLYAVPGTRVMGLEIAAGQSSSRIVEMYDPQCLQVRADVRLEDVPLVKQGQPVVIATASSAEAIRGIVLQITSSANIQKNTLEVKVEILDPPATIRPEMLVTATFLASMSESEEIGTSETERIFVPRQLLQTSEAGSFVWIVDERSIARKRVVELEGKGTGELIAVKSGLNITDKVITSEREELKDGSRVRVTGDDTTIGVN